jgi:hypothetical protein
MTPLAERLLNRTALDGSCWVWTGYRDSKGYGRVGDATGRTVLVHRASYEVHVGSIPDGLCVLHHCDNPPCMNPAHLFLGTRVDNNHDMMRKGRIQRGDTHWTTRQPERIARGPKNGLSKLTPEAVATIRREYAAGGVTHRALAERFGVSRRAVTHVLAGSTWALNERPWSAVRASKRLPRRSRVRNPVLAPSDRRQPQMRSR